MTDYHEMKLVVPDLWVGVDFHPSDQASEQQHVFNI